MQWRMESQLSLRALFLFQFVLIAATSIATSNDSRCVGYDIDFSRLQTVSKNDLSLLMNNAVDGSVTYERSQVSEIHADILSNQIASPRCIGTRHRLQEKIKGVPVHGADMIVTVSQCENSNASSSESPTPIEGSFLTLFSTLPEASIKDIHGHTFSSVVAPSMDNMPSKTKIEAMDAIASLLGIDVSAVGEVTLEFYISTGGDFLAYFAYALVESEKTTDLIHVILDAHDLSVISKCTLTSGETDVFRERRLRAPPSFGMENQRRSLLTCKSCAEDISVMWYGNETECPISSLYLDNTVETTICTVGKDRGNGNIVLGPGPVDEIFWTGTLNCNEATTCTSSVLPSCRDALSDVQFGGVATLKYLRTFLGFKGGLKKDSTFPISIKAYAHYQNQYCNAFYSPATNNVYFGDCNCRTWGPLVSLDIVGHEIGHGVTQHSSNLVYSGQPGGMNEALSDIMGTTIEFLVNDPNNKPDFLIGEAVGQALRNMEFPFGKSIGSICDYTSSLQVHYSSGVVNKAFVNSVRSCALSGCDNLRGCALLMGTSFAYANINGLTRTSTFLEGAEATCKLVDEYFTVLTPSDVCTAMQVKKFLKDGWASVDVSVDDNCNAAEDCGGPTPVPIATPTKHPTASPSRSPTNKPTASPTSQPTKQLSASPTSTPKKDPTSAPTMSPTPRPSTESTGHPTHVLTPGPTSATLSASPTSMPRKDPTSAPTMLATPTPSTERTGHPTHVLTPRPTSATLSSPLPTGAGPTAELTQPPGAATKTLNPSRTTVPTIATPVTTLNPRPANTPGPTLAKLQNSLPTNATGGTPNISIGSCLGVIANFLRRVFSFTWF